MTRWCGAGGMCFAAIVACRREPSVPGSLVASESGQDRASYPMPSIVETGPTPRTAQATAGGRSPSDRYSFELQIVDQPPSAVFLLSRFSEPPGDSCAGRLLEHARGLGANRLYIDRSAPCAGSAYFVPPGFPEASPRINASLRDWLHARWKRPTSITEEDAARLCVVVQFSV